MKSKNSLTSFYSELSFLRSKTTGPVIAVLYILLYKISFLLPIEPMRVSPIFLPAGLALASILITEKRAIFGIGIGTLIVNTFPDLNIANLHSPDLLTHFIVGSVIASGNISAALFSKFIVTQMSKGRHPLYSGETVLILLILGSVCYATISCTIATASLAISNIITINEIWLTFQTSWQGDIIGIILITPFLLSWLYEDSSVPKKINFSEIFFFGTITVILCSYVFFQEYDLKYLILPLLFWSVYRFGTKITSLIIIIIATFEIITTAKGIGPFIKENVNNSILFLDIFLCVISICSFFFSTILTERQRAKNLNKLSKSKLQNNETILEAIIESPKDVSIYSVDRNYEYLNFNNIHKKNIKAMNNVDITIGMTLQESLSNLAELNDAIAVLDKVFEGESITTIRKFDFDGSYWEFKTSPIVNQQHEIIGATIISTNITEQIKADEALKKSEEKYRNIFENIQDIIFQTDLNGTFLNLSPSVKDFCGYTAEELIGQKTYVLQPEEEKNDTVITLIKEQLMLHNYTQTIKTKLGAIKTISLNAKIIFDKNGIPDHVDAIARDITQIKENEKEIALQNQKLQIQNQELEQFVHIASHDLHEPLLTLKYFTEQLKNDSIKELSEDTIQYLNFIFESSDRMQKLVKGLLDYSRIGKQVEISKEDCNKIINESISLLSDSIEKSEAKIHISKLPSIDGYSVELIELFKHLINNSIEFRKKDVPLEINISAEDADNNWLFKIEDNGIGIEEHNHEKIFIIFKRLNNREEYSGIGISLSICKKIVSLHGGTIWAESSFGNGTSIFFTIPKI
ncbi:MASE1 domain-containing protein [Flavobacterium aquicola]|uniref:histidine kinase n=1 Tax=Flavobacterium aquicola TaxID=1682742 RepID=A0A3E0EDC7_9FLAO|nr:MASE1 domain-containing protein [Flavobacterium aquicola]REG96214.1 PAS domain S-box-containing protein [Flavobacterium aquicola]